ncbi:bifunctional UDP-N-acetylmuramoyl-tripeptide:D-alanyl-D-alanine ligase/alanine racemase [Pinibacter aurantiacus]|uniref:bifunctional UDP-N-acetylmuramoyl-tripeptide:D-alanyl-D-alanine ligase/alanine racemase n=1 Tax=Pinibacter aurantiacus TaxID=2851599 RepID=UPI001E5858AD|nr:bifunctional UDP-N-acetylmuramoyl-tripeptide:D-alanyl-D-alanine ligase/alanine racemase [Pinibacter aurantiacus]
MQYTIPTIVQIVKGKLLQTGTDDVSIDRLLLDSRKVLFPASSLFFALKGGRRNGHSFLLETYEKGVRNFVVSEVPEMELPGANIIQVKDTLVALQTLSIHHRKQFKFPVIGITGSNGKTIVKEWLNQLLEADYNIVKSPKSYNSQIGVPLSVWQMDEQYNLGIFEAGISQSGEMEKLEKIIQPTIGVFTNIGEAHSQGFMSTRQKVNEKLQLFKHVNTLIYCKDYSEINEGIASYLHQFQQAESRPDMKLFDWSAKTGATVRVCSIVKKNNSTTIEAEYNGAKISLKVPFIDDASIENAITCWCVLLHENVDQNVIAERMMQLTQVAMRLELKKGTNNCSIINDSYSADISSLKIALDFLAQQQQHPKRTVILSDILQSAESDAELYDIVARTLKEKHINRLIGIGDHISRHHKSFEKIEGLETHFYPSTEAFKRDFYHYNFTNESILLKGARIFKFEQVSRLLEQKAHQTVLEINLEAFANNLKVYQQLLQPSTKMMAMVKAFSYGSGSYEVANLLQFHKVDYLAVAYADEGVELRKAGITLPIMVMNPEESSYDAIVQFELQPDLFSFQEMHDFDSFLKKQNIKDFPVHVELETGMNRLGFDILELPLLLEALKNSSFKVQSVFSHLAASEDPNEDEFTRQQGEKFLNACAAIEETLGYKFIKHIANTAGILRHPHLQLDMVRLGIGLYGVDSAETGRLSLQEVSALKTTVAQVKHLHPNDTVGYNRRGKAKENTVIATVRIGYADGYERRLGNGAGKMMINGKLAPVIGSVCMDMTMIDVTGIEDVKEGDEVTVFGNGLSIVDVAKWAGTIPYEIMTGISQRVKRVYFEEG